MQKSLNPQDSLIAIMIIASASDEIMSAKEERQYINIIDLLPVFDQYDKSRVKGVSENVVALLAEEDGLDIMLDNIKKALPEHLNETAYALACDIVAADGRVHEEELRFLEMLRHHLKIDRLNAAAIERGSRARHMRA